MKIAKVLSLFAIASLAVVSCGPQNKENPHGTPTKDPAPVVNEANAGIITLDSEAGKDVVLSLKDKNNELLEFNLLDVEFFRAGTFLGKGLIVSLPPKSDIALRKSSGSKIYFSGTFSKTGSVYKLSGDVAAEIKVDGNNISVTFGGKTVTVSGGFQQATPPANNFLKGLCVSWKITQLEAAITSPDVQHKFNNNDACNLKTIAHYINSKGGKLDENAFEDYVIASINVNADPKTIVVNFEKKGVEPVVGQWSNLNITDGKFKYHLETQLSGKLFKGDADGVISFNDDYSVVTISLDVTSNELNGKVILTAQRI